MAIKQPEVPIGLFGGTFDQMALYAAAILTGFLQPLLNLRRSQA
jgi:hypothetical protein